MSVPKPATFVGLPSADLATLTAASIVVISASEASPYDHGVASHSALAPKTIREASMDFAASLGQIDFDLDATLFPNEGDYRGMVDAGDVATNPFDAAGNRERIEAAVRSILAMGAVPVVLGGDDSVPIPVLRAFEGSGDLHILQIDAHVDWGDVIRGNPVGYGSTMRRAAEFSWVRSMLQVGIRGLGSGESWQIKDARAWGSTLVTAAALHRDGIETVVASIPAASRCFVSIDVDGLDPAVLPAVAMPTPGGLTYEDVIELLRAVAARAAIAGLALVEYVPERDDRFRLSALTAARIVSVALGLIKPGAALSPARG